MPRFGKASGAIGWRLTPRPPRGAALEEGQPNLGDKRLVCVFLKLFATGVFPHPMYPLNGAKRLFSRRQTQQVT